MESANYSSITAEYIRAAPIAPEVKYSAVSSTQCNKQQLDSVWINYFLAQAAGKAGMTKSKNEESSKLHFIP